MLTLKSNSVQYTRLLSTSLDIRAFSNYPTQQLSHIESALYLSSKMVHQHGDHAEIPDKDRVNRPGAWLPADNRVHREWLDRTIDHIDQHGEKELIPVLREFKQLIEENPRIYMYFTEMWDEIPNKAPYQNDPTGESQIRDYRHMLQVLNHVFGRAPEWTDAAASVGMVGVPMAAIFDYAMGTPSGHAAFLDPDVNRMLKKILNEWGKYLKSPESAEVLRDHQAGWFGEVGYKDLMQVANGPNGTSFKFEEMYKCEPSQKHFGFKSWDDFFTRKVQESARPVAAPDDDNIIANPCESKVFNVTRNAKLRDKFWVKGQPYSVIDMLGNDPLSTQFAGATVYQAFLSALSYHRWHAPVSGTVKRCFVRDGTYFSEPLFESSAEGGDIDRGGITVAQGYLSALATRAIIFFEADNPALGLVAFIGIGMDEVSTCEITVREGQRVKKGDEIGMFHFGGSSFCLLFREGVPLGGFPEVGRKDNVPVRGPLAVVGSS
jgi:phosphatidylserine decarboxylase